MNEPRTLATRIVSERSKAPHRKLRPYRLRIAEPGREERELTVEEPTLRIGSRKAADVVLNDPTASRLHAEISLDDQGYRLKDLGSTNGTIVDGYLVRDIYLRPGSTIRVGQTEIVFSLTDDEIEVPTYRSEHFGPLLGRSVAMRELFAVLARVAPTSATVLIEGESGTGKELVAEAVHGASQRAHGPFVVFDCAAVPPELVESELFGHERGAFTGANARRIGRLEEADGGTLFLDELGELPVDLQPKLLRALEKREVRRVGGDRTVAVDVRVVAATNRDLAEEVNRGAFREDLYYRLAVVRVRLAPLRERTDDVGLLVEHFVRQVLAEDPVRAERMLQSISDANRARLAAHPWPGNVRELRNVIERTVALSRRDETPKLEPSTPPPAIAARQSSRPPKRSLGELDLERPFGDLKRELVTDFEREYLTRQLARFDGNFSRAAAASGMDRMYFKRMLKKYR